MKIKAYAKINISLDIVGKRESDGYHLLKMIMQNIDLYDEISIEKQKEGITISCNKNYVPTDSRNLAYKAASLFKETYNIDDGVHIDIVKNIPVSAGLAGGSTDAAAVLKLMNKIFEVNASDEELMNIGLKLGADIPYCINGGTALCEGIGEKITTLQPFKDKILVLVKPSFGVSTKEVYKSFNLDRVRVHPKTDSLIEAMENDDLYYVANNMKNLLENVTLRKHNILIKIKEEMNRYGAVGSMMSGSGPSVFAFFDDMLKAQRCYEKMKESYKEVFLTRTI
ncbi:4-(cytidine 5'-diphospho)-2-C-methyl-D-erythritol kinase [uncultured Clostridium sp.]|uniref:4-(cytidine 5'-diphospho)-2-C-methyl-D-erythritol kinase n=1 Tax=Clostridium sp. TaxID=1506 RepID=UPI0025D4A8C8|nr:4-(cytidine 5'-diphospho)-2-C-methyl-D-erythritol kinase [uncultured Clostridium sp.]